MICIFFIYVKKNDTQTIQLITMSAQKPLHF